MSENYEQIKSINEVHIEFKDKIVEINKENKYRLPEKVFRSYSGYDRHRFQISNELLIKAYEHLVSLIKITKQNKESRKNYIEKLSEAIKKIEEIDIKIDQYGYKKQLNYIIKFAREKRYLGSTYYSEKNFIVSGGVEYVAKYGRIGYKRLVSCDWKEINEMYKNRIHYPEIQKEEAKLRKANSRYGNKIYFYEDVHQPNLICIGQTTRANVEDRIKQQYKRMPNKPFKVLHYEYAQFKNNEKWFDDHAFHRFLVRNGFQHVLDYNGEKTEWFKIDIEKAKELLREFKNKR